MNALERLIPSLEAERGDAIQPTMTVVLDLDSTLGIIGNLQLALRHPLNNGVSAQIARALIDGLIAELREAGYPAHAELAALGDHPRCDS